ncbi:hypothetical protein LCGC14_1115840 [marine sediment metagenome]|uniref:Uncharacterized protein n=1 Tax=marine sediment metagenome TaxID=412755 RepID=A0A0F9MA66_9ZZZZ
MIELHALFVGGLLASISILIIYQLLKWFLRKDEK